MGVLNYLGAAAGMAGAGLEGQQKGEAQKRQTIMDGIRLAIQQQQLEEQAAQRAASIAHTKAQTDALTNRPAPRDPVKDHQADRDYDIAHPLATPPRAPVMGSPEWLNAQDAAAKIRAKYRAPTNSAGKPESPEIAASRRDLKGFQSQQIRAEREVTGLASEGRALLSRHDRADQPMSAQGTRNRAPTAGDSAAVRDYAAIQSRMKNAKDRVDRLAHSADSTQSVINQRRSGVVDETPAPDAAPPMDHAAIVSRATEENRGYLEAVQRIKANVTDPAAQKSALAEAQRIYMLRIQAVNAGRAPEGE